jgi:hypothetical protein
MTLSSLARGSLALALAVCAGCAADAKRDDGAVAAAAVTEQPAAETNLHDRVQRQIESVVGSAYAEHDWEALLSAEQPFSGVKIWVPGTAEATGDEPGRGRAMGAVPADLASDGAAITWDGSEPLPLDAWLGVPCSQSEGGDLFGQRGIFSALDVFNTAWSDALAIVDRFGPRLRGAWLVAHSAGALPALLAGLIGGAHRVDIYGVPSAVGYLDGDDGIAHFHTDPLDPAGAMGWVRPDGTSSINLGGAFVVALEGGGLAHHDYSAWPAPVP